jgi:hypothetical protein
VQPVACFIYVNTGTARQSVAANPGRVYHDMG